MCWRQNTRFILTITLVLWNINFSEGLRKEGDTHDPEGNVDIIIQKHSAKERATTLKVYSFMNQSSEYKKQINSRPIVPFTGLTESTVVKMEELASLAVSVHAPNTLLADTVSMTNGKATVAHLCMENGYGRIANCVDVLMGFFSAYLSNDKTVGV
ncbi:hypothetical protein E2320_017428 [Naja naja]|nr:hypothetical protein E2320_017428 [Naja naja]